MAKKMIHFFLLNGITAETWTVPQSNVMIKDPEKGLKKIAYIPGTQTIFWDDIPEGYRKAYKKSYITFVTGHLLVDEDNKTLVEYLRKHPRFGQLWSETNTQKESEDKIEEANKVEKAFELFKSDKLSVMTVAVALYGESALDENILGLEARIKSMVILREPQKIIDIYSDKGNFKYKKIVCAAIAQKVIYVNGSKTAVLWTDSEENIITVGVGQNPIDELSKFIGSKDNLTTLQAISVKLVKTEAPTEVEKAKDVDTSNNLTGSDKELLDLQIAYEEKFGHPPGPSKKNDIQWLKMKLTE